MRMKADTKEKKQKIKQLNQEIANMKKENYEIFYKFNIEDNKKQKSVSFSPNLIFFIISFFALTVSLIYFMQSVQIITLYVGEKTIPNWLLSAPFIIGIFLTYFVSDKTIPIITAVFGLICIIFVLFLDDNFILAYRPDWQYILIFCGLISGLLSCVFLIFIKNKK